MHVRPRAFGDAAVCVCVCVCVGGGGGGGEAQHCVQTHVSANPASRHRQVDVWALAMGLLVNVSFTNSK